LIQIDDVDLTGSTPPYHSARRPTLVIDTMFELTFVLRGIEVALRFSDNAILSIFQAPNRRFKRVFPAGASVPTSMRLRFAA
jgi:hypothetical protein